MIESKMSKKRSIPTRVREIVDERDSGICQWDDCELSRSNGDRMNLHHVHPEQFGGTEDPNNLVTLCDIHHKMMHAEFHAFYPDSEGVLKKMNKLLRVFLSKYRKKFGVDDGYDLTPYLKFLTKKDHFRPGQLKVIREILAGNSVLFVTPTGTGKSICYQIPGLISNHPTLVVSPLKALMKDQVESIWARKIPTTYINSDLSKQEKDNRYKFINNDLYKFIFVAPERFDSNSSKSSSLYRKYSYLVIDEAHEIEMWGMAFRPSYRKLGSVRASIGNPPVIALTATATKNTQTAILESLNITDAKVVVTGFYRENIQINIYKTGYFNDDEIYHTKEEYIKQHLLYETDGKTLIFTPTIKKSEELHEYLHNTGFNVGLYHGKLDAKAKMKVQNQFSGNSKPELNILVCTSAFGMGIDIPNIRNIIHYSPPLSITDYVQQIGRAGRDGKRSYAYLLYNPQDYNLMRYMTVLPMKTSNFKQNHNYSDEDMEHVREKLLRQSEEMIEFTQIDQKYAWDYILNYFGEEKLSFWNKYGLRIVDTFLVFVMSLCAVLLLFYFVKIIVISLNIFYN